MTATLERAHGITVTAGAFMKSQIAIHFVKEDDELDATYTLSIEEATILIGQLSTAVVDATS